MFSLVYLTATLKINRSDVLLGGMSSAIAIPSGIGYASFNGPEAALFCDLSDTKVCYSGISFDHQFFGIFVSGIKPIIATGQLKSGGGAPWRVCAYLVFAGLVPAIVARLSGRHPEHVSG